MPTKPGTDALDPAAHARVGIDPNLALGCERDIREAGDVVERQPLRVFLRRALPCPTTDSLGTGTNSTVTMLQATDRKPSPGSPYTGGGIKLLWRIAVDGDDTVWAFNFGAAPPPGLTITTPTAISRLCGVDTKKCPPGLKTGDPISPSSGYQSDAFVRITSGAIDPFTPRIYIPTHRAVQRPLFHQ